MSKTENLLVKLGKMTEADCIAKLADYKVTPFKTKEETEYFAKYLVQGEVTQKLKGLANVTYARKGVDELFHIQPHLATKYAQRVMEIIVQSSKVAVPKVAKTPKVKVTKSVQPDGTVQYREDRQKWVAWYAGKQEAARPTVEGCLSFLKKKYNIDGVVVK